MIKTYLYIPEDLDKKIKETAKIEKKSKAEVIRHALEKGLSSNESHINASVNVLLELAELGKKHHVKGPEDASNNLDHYLWDFPKKK